MSDFRVALGVQGAQTHTSAGRGLERYVLGQAAALVEHRPDHLVQLSCDGDLAVPATLAALGRRVELAPSTRPPEPDGLLVYHVLSPFELLRLDRVWPEWAQRVEVGLVVTLHDLIPLIYRDVYLADPHLRKWYLPRLELVRGADAVVAISEATADDAVRLLGLPRERIFVSGEDVGPEFQPVAGGGLPNVAGLRPGFVLAVGGLDVRKNIPRLVEAYAGLAPQLRAAHQLVLAGTWLPDERRELERLVGPIRGDVLLAGQVSDELLVALYQACDLFVMPSTYEGFGLPVLEAMRCGAQVIAADATSLRELVTLDEARFDPLSTDRMRDVLLRALTDDGFRARLRQASVDGAARYSWKRASDAVVAAHELAAARRARFSRPR